MLRAVLLVLGLAMAGCAASKPVVGEQLIRHPNGEVRFAADTLDGVPHGPGARYYDNGQLEYKGHYRHGDRSGLFQFYDREGNWIRQELFAENASLWTSSVEADAPPAELLDAVTKSQSHTGKTLGPEDLPRPLFATMDLLSRGVLARATFQEFLRDEEDDSSVTRAMVTQLAASVAVARDSTGADYEVYGSISAPTVQNDGGGQERLAGKRTAELGAARTTFGGLSVAAGLAFPIAGDTGEGYRAAVNAGQLGTSVPSGIYPRTIAFRSKASWARLTGQWVYRVDGGIDTAFDSGGDEDLATRNTPVVVPRVAALAGRRTERFLISGQLHWQKPLNDGINQTVANASITAEFLIGRLRPGASLYLPLAGVHTDIGVGFSLSYALF